jgi:peptide-methionine (R)-S-oxide reductase
MSMNRREFLQGAIPAAIALLVLPAAAKMEKAGSTAATTEESITPLEKPRSEWRKILEPARYAVLFEESTEPPFSSPLYEEKRVGTYLCAACRLPLFRSKTKFDSGTGWPSFYAPIPGHMGIKRDFRLILPRTEYHCIRCGGHQGHVFKDGPPPTGQRWCNNGLALAFVTEGEPLPALRS